MTSFSAVEKIMLRKLSTPVKIQDFLNSLPINFELSGETFRSPLRVVRDRTAHCAEGAVFAAFALRRIGRRPLLLDLLADKTDEDHVVAPFRVNSCWGAISKTNHAVLRYREPVYRTIRELALSYFHEYFTHAGLKTLRFYSRPVDLSHLDARGWVTDTEDLWYIDDHLDQVRHYPILPRGIRQKLRRADPIEIAAGRLVEWKKPTRHREDS